MHTPYADALGMLLHMNGKFTIGKLKSFEKDMHYYSTWKLTNNETQRDMRC